MSEFHDLDGREDACHSYTTKEAQERTAVGRALSATTLRDAMKGAVGYFTVYVDLPEKGYCLQYAGDDEWWLNIDTRPDPEGISWEDYQRACKTATIENWRIEIPNLALPVRGGERGEDVVAFHADWGMEKIVKEYLLTLESCPECWKRIRDFPRRSLYYNVKPEDATDSMMMSYYLTGESLSVHTASNGKILYRNCSWPGCRFFNPERKVEVAKLSVYCWMDDEQGRAGQHNGSENHVNLTAEEAVMVAKRVTDRWPVCRVIITDSGDCCTFEWEKGWGVVFPTREQAAG